MAAMNYADLDQLITIEPLEEIVCRLDGTADKREGKERLSILFIREGGGRCVQGRETIVLREKTIYTGWADSFGRIEIDAGASGYLVRINPGKLQTILENVTVAYKSLFAVNRPCLHLDAEAAEEMDWLLTQILKKGRSKEKYKMEIIQRYISLLMLHLRSGLEDELVLVSMNRKGMLINEFFALLEDTFMTAKTVDYYAEKLCVTPKHLTNVIKLQSGYPTSYHINQRIVLEAKRKASGASLKQIAYELGYEDVAAFSKLFKRVTGENFSAYKLNLKFAFANRAMR